MVYKQKQKGTYKKGHTKTPIKKLQVDSAKLITQKQLPSRLPHSTQTQITKPTFLVTDQNKFLRRAAVSYGRNLGAQSDTSLSREKLTSS